ncbi:uncharacterized protein LOC100366614 [Saccoglossus kowalevskii]|uniref:Uncharacterized protein LOC100366614 n=1 Tax=Saccoglossus kowalevskii TaxID=10224 RepID=A0ABM0MG85_SACKO|nr:PREDICTED: uncharacterized protein LOC100366614 [Saccoglossus kowalevskii]
MSAEGIVTSSPMMSLPNPFPTPYRILLHSISQELQKDHVDQLRLLFKSEEDQGMGFTIEDVDSIRTGTQLILRMEDRGILSRGNLHALKRGLHLINRKDLVDKVDTYLSIDCDQDGGG